MLTQTGRLKIARGLELARRLLKNSTIVTQCRPC